MIDNVNVIPMRSNTYRILYTRTQKPRVYISLGVFLKNFTQTVIVVILCNVHIASMYENTSRSPKSRNTQTSGTPCAKHRPFQSAKHLNSEIQRIDNVDTIVVNLTIDGLEKTTLTMSF